MTDNAGQPARVVGGWERIGPEECPLLFRKTLLSSRLGKLLYHRFVAGASDSDPHDHPRSFLTVVLRGGYDDIRADGLVDRVRAPTVRFRSADHAHITKVGPAGATTIVIMGPLRRDWGFWRDGKWWQWRAYELRFGMGFRCDREETDAAPVE